MNEEDFCKIFLFSLMNFICYYLSIIFLTSAYNAKSQANYYEKFIDKCIINKDSYDKQYAAIATFFTFITIMFLIYIIQLILIIKKNKLDVETKYFYTKENKITNEEDNHEEDVRVKKGPSTRERIYIKNNITNQYNNSNDRTDNVNENKKEKSILFFSFLIIQILYFIELILLSIFHRKAKNQQQNCISLKNITKIYTGLLIVGYILFGIFIFFYIYLFILYNKLGIEAKDRFEKLTNSKYCECFNQCLKKLCTKCVEFFRTETDKELEKKNNIKIKELKEIIQKKEEQIKDLESYKNNLEGLKSIMNHPGINKQKTIKNKFNKLNLNYLSKN